MIDSDGFNNSATSELEKPISANNTTRYAEYENYGPGADKTARVASSNQLTDEEEKKCSVKNILSDWIVK
jgi:pectinesterase